MNKIILLSDNKKMPKGAFDFACMLNEQQPILLSGIFLPTNAYWDVLHYYSYGTGYPLNIDLVESAEDSERAIKDFETLCQQSGIEYRVHTYPYEHIREQLRIDSRFADMIIFSSEALEDHLDALVSGEYTQEALNLTECPVIVVPENFTRPTRLILAYDGSRSSVHAIKEFAYLMPDLASMNALLIYMNPDPDRTIPYKENMKELATRHYPNLSIMKLDKDPGEYPDTWLANVNNAMMVVGAKGRSGLSELFKRSFADKLIREHVQPVLIAHY